MRHLIIPTQTLTKGIGNKKTAGLQTNPEILLNFNLTKAKVGQRSSSAGRREKYQIATLAISARKVFNPFSTNIPLLYPLKTSENLRFSDVFWRYRSGTWAENGLIVQ